MRGTENWRRHIVWWLSKFFLHYFPLFNYFLLSRTTHMIAVSASLEVTLNAATIFLVTDTTNQFTSSTWHFSSNCGNVIVSKPHFRYPVDANDMSPWWFISSDGFYDAFNLWTHRALDVCAGHVLFLDQLNTSDTEPRLIGVRKSVLDLTTVARLVSSCLA